MKRAGVLLCAFALTVGCNGTTGSELVRFSVAGGGPAAAVAGEPYVFTSARGYEVSLTSATLHLDALYLNQSEPSSGGPQEPCILPGIYVGEAFGSCNASGVCGVDVDLLSPQLVPFPVAGQGTANRALEADVWLSGGDINAATDDTPILQVAGTATQSDANGGAVTNQWPFSATLTISQNRAQPAPNPGMPGENPICRKRIVSLIPVDFTLVEGGALSLRIDPAGLFSEVDFSQLAASGSVTPVTIPDDTSVEGEALYDGVMSNAGVYQFTWANPGP